MNVKQFFATNAREALQQVKREIGSDAVILSNRRVAGGVEILAIPHTDARALEDAVREPQAALSPLVRTATNNPVATRSRTINVKMPGPANARQAGASVGASAVSSPVPSSGAKAVRPLPPVAAAPIIAHAVQRPAPALNPAPATHSPVPAAEQIARTVIREIQSMRGLINEQLSGLMFGEMQRREPDKLRIMSTLLASGFSPALSRRLLEKAPPGGTAASLRAWIKKALDKNLVVSAADDIVNKGGVYALLGPTGVGKTTTTAKLAARCVVRHGAGKVALLTTDNYRVGAHEHLRIYARILGVSVHAVRDAADLEIALSELRGKHVVLIDTVGMSQRAEQVAEQVAMFSAQPTGIKRVLLLNATCQGDTLEDVVNAYKGKSKRNSEIGGKADSDGLAGCIITKTDEAASLGAVLDTAIRHQLPVHYVANGQRVPEDIHPVNREYLLHRALASGADHPARALSEQDLPAALMGAQFAV